MGSKLVHPFTLPSGTSNVSNGQNVSFNWVLHIIGPEIPIPLVVFKASSGVAALRYWMV